MSIWGIRWPFQHNQPRLSHDPCLLLISSCSFFSHWIRVDLCAQTTCQSNDLQLVNLDRKRHFGFFLFLDHSLWRKPAASVGDTQAAYEESAWLRTEASNQSPNESVTLEGILQPQETFAWLQPPWRLTATSWETLDQNHLVSTSKFLISMGVAGRGRVSVGGASGSWSQLLVSGLWIQTRCWACSLLKKN